MLGTTGEKESSKRNCRSLMTFATVIILAVGLLMSGGSIGQCVTLAPVISVPAPSSQSFFVEVDPSLISSYQRKKLQLTFNAGGVAKWTQTVNVPALTSAADYWVNYRYMGKRRQRL